MILGFKNTLLLVLVTVSFVSFSCLQAPKTKNTAFKTDLETKKDTTLLTGADQWQLYVPLLKDKTIGVVANQTSVLFKANKYKVPIHIVDFLLQKHQNIQAVFAPEHGFRGNADAGEKFKNGTDLKTGLPIISLYGKNKKPTREQLKGIAIMVFDIQDVGARFYTYISTLHYVMEACAENNIPLIVLDRPNPNGNFIDGPLLEKEHSSFVGMHPVPVVHGMTIGEYAQMINGQKWLDQGIQCDLTIIRLKNYTHNTRYSLPIKPSPNLPNDTAINLYPSLCFFEGTPISVGRGTNMQFQVFGAPFLPKELFQFTFTPYPNLGAKHPKHNGKICYGKDLRNVKPLNRLDLTWLISAYTNSPDKAHFFMPFFTKLAGTKKLEQQIKQGYTYREIRKTWLSDLDKYNRMRQQYLLYE